MRMWMSNHNQYLADILNVWSLDVVVDGEGESVGGEPVGPDPEHPAAPAALRRRLRLKLRDGVLVQGHTPRGVLAKHRAIGNTATAIQSVARF